jgi:hypothetical protein
VGSATRQGVRAQARVLAGGLRARGTHRVCGRSSRTLLVCGDRLGWAGSGSVGDAAAACSAFGFFLGAAFFAAGAFRLGGIAVQRRVLGRPRALLLYWVDRDYSSRALLPPRQGRAPRRPKRWRAHSHVTHTETREAAIQVSIVCLHPRPAVRERSPCKKGCGCFIIMAVGAPLAGRGLCTPVSARNHALAWQRGR